MEERKRSKEIDLQQLRKSAERCERQGLASLPPMNGGLSLMKSIAHVATAFIVRVRAAIFDKAQPPAAACSPGNADVLKALDQAVEKNRRLVVQNRELMEQVNTLRQKFTARPPVSRRRG